MKSIPHCDKDGCLRSPRCWPRKHADRWVSEFWVAVGLAHDRARRSGRRQQVRRANVGLGVGWIVQEIR